MNTLAIDPTVSLIIRAALSLLFGSAAAHKLRDVASFRIAVERYELLPPLWAVPVGAALIAAEVAIAVGLWLPRVAPVAAVAAAALLALYAVAIAVNLRRGRRDLDCGCGGPAGRRPISGWLVVRNGVVAAAAVAGALPVTARALTWVDWVTVASGVVTVALLYVAGDGLAAVHRRGSQRNAEGILNHG